MGRQVTGEILLHDYWRSSSAYRLRIALNLLGLAYTSHPVDLVAGQQRGAENLARNPQGLVPTLQIDGATLTQSLAILEYLDEVHGAGFLPPDPLGRARVRALSYAVAMEVQPVCNLRVASHAVSQSGGVLTIEAWMQHFIPLGLQGLEVMLTRPGQYCHGLYSHGLYCHGDQISMADICLVPQVYNARRWGIDLGACPVLSRIAERLDLLPAVQAAHPDRVKPAA